MTKLDPVRAALADEWDRYIAPGGGKRDYITPDLIDRTIKALRDHLPTRPNPDMAGCICCANGNDIPDGEYCRACGREGKTTPLGAAIMRARGKDGPPSAPVQFDGPALPPTLNSGAVEKTLGQLKAGHWAIGSYFGGDFCLNQHATDELIAALALSRTADDGAVTLTKDDQ